MTLLLLPNLLGNHRHHEPYLPASVDKAVATLQGLIAESAGEGRRFLSRFAHEKKPHEIPMALYNTNTPDADLDFLLEPLVKGERWGLISDAGLPCISDPGFKLVKRARQRGIAVQAFVGPSALMMSLMLSGLPGQRFTFHGYVEQNAEAIQRLERASLKDEATQLFIEAPFRNQAMLEHLLQHLSPKTQLCIACDLTLPTQTIETHPVEVWKKRDLPNLHKKPTMFLLYADK